MQRNNPNRTQSVFSQQQASGYPLDAEFEAELQQALFENSFNLAANLESLNLLSPEESVFSDISLTPSVSATTGLSTSNSSASGTENALPFPSNSLIGHKRSYEQMDQYREKPLEIRFTEKGREKEPEKQITKIFKERIENLTPSNRTTNLRYRSGKAVPDSAIISQNEKGKYFATVNGKLERVYTPAEFRDARLRYFNGDPVPPNVNITENDGEYFATVNGKSEQVYTTAALRMLRLRAKKAASAGKEKFKFKHNGDVVPDDAIIYEQEKGRRQYYTLINDQEVPVLKANAYRQLRSRLKAQKAASAGVEGPPLAANDTSIQNLPSLVENPLSFFNPPQNDAHNFNDMMNANNEDNNSEENFVTVSNSWGWAI